MFERHVVILCLFFLDLLRKEEGVEVKFFKLIRDQLLLLDSLHHFRISDECLREVHRGKLSSIRAKSRLGLPKYFSILLAFLISFSWVIKCLLSFFLLVLKVVKALFIKLNSDRCELVPSRGCLLHCRHSFERVDVFEAYSLLVPCKTDPE